MRAPLPGRSLATVVGVWLALGAPARGQAPGPEAEAEPSTAIEAAEAEAGTPEKAGAEPAPAEAPITTDDSAAEAPEPAEPLAPEVSAAATPPAPTEAAPETALTSAELAELGLTPADLGEKSVLVSTPLQFSGFADFSMMTFLARQDSPWRSAFNRYPAFFIGNFNLYMSKDLTRHLRMFSEVRFTLLPNGAPVLGSPSGEYVSTAVPDYSDFSRSLEWGGIEIERVYLEWNAHQLLTFRIGIFLTPYGIWNVDHGTPTIIPVQRPFVIGAQLFPERQTGLEVYGATDVGTHHSVGYHLTVSNGLGPVSSYRDFDRNKAVGGRLYWRYRRLGTLQLGASAFYGTDTAAREVPSLDPSDNRVTYTEAIDAQSKVLSLAADVRWEWQGLLLQTEFITQQRAYTERGRVGATNPLLGRYLAPTDRLSWGAYGLAGYRFDWYGVMPYVVVQSSDNISDVTSILQRVISYSAGLNIRPIPVLAAKLEYTEGHWPEGHILTDEPVRFVQTQIAWAF